jgi:hypothetical protein
MLSTTYVAVRQHGVCRGTLWRQEGAPSSSSSSSHHKKKKSGSAGTAAAASPTSSSSSSYETTDYCVATGNLLAAYESFTFFQRGDVPTRLYEVVGASSPSLTMTTSTLDSSSNSKSFCLVTNQGTHVYCQAVTRKCRDMWLATLQAGLQVSLLQQQPPKMMTTIPTIPTRNTGRDDERPKQSPLSSPEPIQSVQEEEQDQQQDQDEQQPPPNTTAPLHIKTGMFRNIAAAFERRPPVVKSCLSCGALEWTAATAAAGLTSPKSSSTPSSPTMAAGSSHSHSASATKTKAIIYSNASPVSHYGREQRCDLCRDCINAQGVIHHLQFLKTCMATARQEKQALLQARQLCASVILAKETTMTATNRDPEDEKGEVKKTDQKEAKATNIEEGEEEGEMKIADQKKEVNDDDDETDKPLEKQQEEQIIDSHVDDENKNAVAMEVTDTNDDGEHPADTKDVVETVVETPSSSSPPPPEPAEDKSSDASSNESWTHVETTLSGEDHHHRPQSPPPTTRTTAATMAAGSTSSSTGAQQQQQQPDWIHVAPSSASSTAVLELVQDKQRFGSLTRVSPFLEMLVEDLLLQGRIGVADFLEQLEEAVAQTETDSLAKLKKQAFRVAGDMGTAMKLLVEHALPKQQHDLAALFHNYEFSFSSAASPAAENSTYNANSSSHAMSALTSLATSSSTTAVAATASSAVAGGGTETLACLLEFFLDLCEEGELSAVSFFWPQLCHLHLCMLPAENAAAVARVDLVEDFLLTVATRFSIHLVMELVWSHTADLEESLDYHPESFSYAFTSSAPVGAAGSVGGTTSHSAGAGLGGPSSGATATLLAASCCTPCAMSCRRRRFAVLRFVCEFAVMFNNRHYPPRRILQHCHHQNCKGKAFLPRGD